MKKIFQIMITAIFLFSIWQILVEVFNISPYILPSPLQIALAAKNNYPEMLSASLYTIVEILLGFLLAFAIASAITVWSNHSRYINDAIHPLLAILQMLPVIAFAPLVLIWFGHGLLSEVVIAAAISIFPIALNFKKGLDSTDQHLIDIARSIGCTRIKILQKIQFPFALPYLFSGLKMGMSLAVIGAIVGEFVGSSKGLGYQILYSNTFLQTPLMFAYLFLVIMIGMTLNSALTYLEKKIVFWKKEIILE